MKRLEPEYQICYRSTGRPIAQMLLMLLIVAWEFDRVFAIARSLDRRVRGPQGMSNTDRRPRAPGPPDLCLAAGAKAPTTYLGSG